MYFYMFLNSLFYYTLYKELFKESLDFNDNVFHMHLVMLIFGQSKLMKKSYEGFLKMWLHFNFMCKGFMKLSHIIIYFTKEQI